MAVAIITLITALTHCQLWGTIIFISEFFNRDYSAIYRGVWQCVGKCYSREPLVAACLAVVISTGALAHYLPPTHWLLSTLVPPPDHVLYLLYCNPLVLLTISVAVLAQHLVDNLVSEVEIIRAAHKNSLNVYKGLAWSYVMHLRDVLIPVSQQADGPAGKHMLLLIPTDAYCPPTVGYPCSEPQVKSVGERCLATITRAGHMARKLYAAVYDVKHAGRQRRCLCDYPAVLQTLFDMCQSGQIHADDLPYHVKQFTAETRRLLCANHQYAYVMDDCIAKLLLYQPQVPSGQVAGGDGEGQTFEYGRTCNHGREIYEAWQEYDYQQCQACLGDAAPGRDCDQCRCLVRQCPACKANTDLVSRILSETIDDLQC